MIIKFDHISFIGSRINKEKILKDKGEALFKEIRLKNLDIKKNLMYVPQIDHDLYFYDGNYPTEYIFYDTVEVNSKIELIDNTVYGKYTNKQGALEFLKGIFGNKVTEKNNILSCNMKGILDKRDYMLVLSNSDENIDAHLDDEGYGVITLINSARFSNVPIDGICTDTEILEVNGKQLEICFTKSASTNIIFEMIKVCS